MAKEKDFSTLSNFIAEATAEAPQETIEEVAEAKAIMPKTQGRAGEKLNRINMGFKPANYEYIKTMSRVRGETMTQFVNAIIEKSLQDNADTYRKAADFFNALK